MLFNSYEFLLLFMPIVIIVFFQIAKIYGNKAATLWLVISSLFFYGWWDWHYVPLLLMSIMFNYYIGKYIEKSEFCKRKWLITGIIGNFLLLGYYKYMGFFIENINLISGNDLYEIPNIILPLGISFFTFTQTAYLVDAYRGETKNDSFLTYCEFVTIFPHLIAGPIITHKNMIPQFLSADTFKINWNNIALGITMFAMGLFKKVIIADNLSILVLKCFSFTDNISMLDAWFGAVAYTLQLYFDFSGYSEMAIGLGLMINLKFPINFNSPYQATSIIDFWRRWHMTLGTWVREYLYIPMGGNRHGEIRKMFNLFTSMLIIGFWHGAGWTFILWGGLHGILLMINHQWRRFNIALPKVINWGLTFIFVIFCWVLFRAENMEIASNIIGAMLGLNDMCVVTGHRYSGTDMKFITAILIIVLACPNPQWWLDRFKPNKKWIAAIVVMLIWSIMELYKYSEFLYFQF